MDEVKNEAKLNTRKVIKISKKRLIVSIVLIVLLLIIWGVLSTTRNTFSVDKSINSMGDSVVPYTPSDYDESSKSISQDYYYGGYGEPSITDTREFLKTSYSATIKTRSVSDVTRDVKNIIKGADGRVDSFNSGEKRGYISFVVAKSKFDAFKDEIESITHEKLYTENISSQNLLSQKQGIEEQTGNIVSTLDNLKNQKASLDTKHTQAVSSINKELASIKTELITVRANIAATTDSSIILALRNQESSLVAQETLQKKNLNSENNNYSIQSKNLADLISNENSNLTNVNKQDSQFTDNIETVSGNISVHWVSLWELARIFSPVPPFLVIVILVIIAIICYRKRIPKVVLE